MAAPPDGLVLRSAEEGDLGRIVELVVLGAVPGGPPSVDDPTRLDQYERAWRDIVDRGDEVIVAELDGVVVGTCQLLVFRHLQGGGGLCAELESVHVHPDRPGGG